MKSKRDTRLCCDGFSCPSILLIFQVRAKVLEGYLVQLECSLVVASVVLSNSLLHILCRRKHPC